MKLNLPNKNSRILTLKSFLETCTDELNPTTMSAILDYLKKQNIPATRKSITQDIELLIAHGVDVVCNMGHTHEYFIGEHHFQLPELKLLVDAVSASGFITPAKSKELIEKLSAFTSGYQAQELDRQLYVDEHVKTENKHIYTTVDLLYTAINSCHKISFKYYDYNQHKKREYKHNGYVYLFSPYAMLWNKDRYYVIGYSDKHEKIISFRVDRIAVPKILKDTVAHPKPKSFNITLYTQSIFQMYGDGEVHTVTLKCANEVMSSIVDYFGTEVKTMVLDDHHFTAEVEVSISPTFFGWVVGFGGKIKVAGPNTAVEEYRNLVSQMI